mmetsp:Transcript_59016/g.63702  ORF Transcript_59016/g.63702 Transcript_59016/m.63702 type:complete len:102 (-) Transcript_59016:168-473(-)
MGWIVFLQNLGRTILVEVKSIWVPIASSTKYAEALVLNKTVGQWTSLWVNVLSQVVSKESSYKSAIDPGGDVVKLSVRGRRRRRTGATIVDIQYISDLGEK